MNLTEEQRNALITLLNFLRAESQVMQENGCSGNCRMERAKLASDLLPVVESILVDSRHPGFEVFRWERAVIVAEDAKKRGQSIPAAVYHWCRDACRMEPGDAAVVACNKDMLKHYAAKKA